MLQIKHTFSIYVHAFFDLIFFKNSSDKGIAPKKLHFFQDWPVDADWLKTKLHSILCGSTKEVYETGSQVADLHLMLSTMIPSITSGTCGARLRDAVNRACSEGFPDLAREMGLGCLGSDNVDRGLLTEGKEDQVQAFISCFFFSLPV